MILLPSFDSLNVENRHRQALERIMGIAILYTLSLVRDSLINLWHPIQNPSQHALVNRDNVYREYIPTGSRMLYALQK